MRRKHRQEGDPDDPLFQICQPPLNCMTITLLYAAKVPSIR